MGQILDIHRDIKIIQPLNMPHTPEGRRYKAEEVAADNGYVLKDVYLPEEILVLILSYLDNEALSKVRYVCRKWCELIREEVWKVKAERELSKRFRKIKPYRRFPSQVYQGMCWKDAYDRNLIKNHSGQNKNNQFWKVLINGGDSWKVETPPVGVTIPKNELTREPQSCFVTSYQSCSKQQLVDLCAEGIHPDILDTFQPDIVVSEWYAARWDCGSVYELKVSLLDDMGTERSMFDFQFQVRMTNWMAGWKEVKHKFQNYGPGVRFVRFLHSGCDSQFWAGHYGSKMANANVFVDLQSIEEHQYKSAKDEMGDSFPLD